MLQLPEELCSYQDDTLMLVFCKLSLFDHHLLSSQSLVYHNSFSLLKFTCISLPIETYSFIKIINIYFIHLLLNNQAVLKVVPKQLFVFPHQKELICLQLCVIYHVELIISFRQVLLTIWLQKNCAALYFYQETFLPIANNNIIKHILKLKLEMQS